MAQKLQPLALIPTAHLSLEINTRDFHTGYVEGLTADTRRFDVRDGASEEGLVEIVRNLIEIGQEGWLNEEQLRRDVGLLAGWICRRQFHLHNDEGCRE